MDLQISKSVFDKFQIAQLARDLNKLIERNKQVDAQKEHKLRKRANGKQKRL